MTVLKNWFRELIKADRKKDQVKKDAFMLELNDERQKFFEISQKYGARIWTRKCSVNP